jgi:hypothetical protein
LTLTQNATCFSYPLEIGYGTAWNDVQGAK